MISRNNHETKYTYQIRTLISRVYDFAARDSFLAEAIAFMLEQQQNQEKLDEFASEIEETTAKLEQQQSVAPKLAKLEQEKDAFDAVLKVERLKRQKNLDFLCHEVIELTEGMDFEESNRKSAQFLGTIQLLSPTDEVRKREQINTKNKPLYKAILCLRLLDRLCIDNKITDTYVKYYLGSYVGEKYLTFKEENEEAYLKFIEYVKIPIIMAVLLQDIGNYHPDAQFILVGEEGDLNEFRVLELEERKSLLQINYRETLNYLAEGIGVGEYTGNSKPEREQFKKAENKKLIFIKTLLKNSIRPTESLGNLLKIPQIYASIILSTKDNYNYKLLPRVFQVLNQNAERGVCDQDIVNDFYKVVGMFPQGYGVTYIPLDVDGDVIDRFEYAIVNRLYPEVPEHPNCRTATRQLAYIGYGHDITITEGNNMYFPESAKKLANISKKRLLEILESLASNSQERAENDLIPRCWYPNDYFSIKTNQKLWVRDRPNEEEI